jgi:chromosome segregation ATPase
LRSEEVSAAIEAAQSSVYYAQSADLASSARPSLARAEQKLEEARRAFDRKRGATAFRAAHEARLEAQHAMSLDVQADAFAELLAVQEDRHRFLAQELTDARTDTEAARAAARRVETTLAQMRTELRDIEDRYRQDLEQTLREKEEAVARAQAVEQERAATQERIAALTLLLEDARSRQEAAERRVEEVAGQVERARSEVEVARSAATRREREVQTVRQQAKELAEAYSERIDTIRREQQRDSALASARQDAQRRAPTSNISSSIIEAVRPTALEWKRSWDRGDITAHLEFYAPGARGERVAVTEGRESSVTPLSRNQLMSQLRTISRGEWQETSQASVQGEGDDIVAQMTYRQKDAGADSVHFWTRKAYWQKSGNDWKVVRERWTHYYDVPQFPRP